ncbi:hypothetical protein ABW20_dc0108608 [Dactylellina cionopaga]|nr:hypothetical protein ABW20_dc0108608 [Dactylellina cionopaga]
MANQMQKSPLEELPLELKIEILKSLDSLYDYDALSLSCRTFYNISKGPLSTSVQRRLVGRGDLGKLLRTLAILREYGRDQRVSTLSDTFPVVHGENATDNTEYLNRLLSYRDVVRWFSRRLFTAMLAKFAGNLLTATEASKIDKPQPTRTELARVDETFLAQWIYVEITFIFIRRRPTNMNDLEQFVPGDEQGLVVSLDLGVMCNVQMFTMDLLAPMIVRYVEECRNTADTLAMATQVSCLDLYHRRGIPNIMLWQHAFDGLKSFLQSPWEEKKSIIEKSYSHATNYDRLMESEATYIGYFAGIVDNIWDLCTDEARKSYHLRPLWRQKGKIYRTGAPPWDQGEGFELHAIFCDDERLEQLGFVPPEKVNNEVQELAGGSLLEVRLKNRGCRCHATWGCTNAGN